MKSLRDEDAFIKAVLASPEDEAVRLVYADWLDEQNDPRAAYLRAEVEQFRTGQEVRDVVLRSLRSQIDPVWVAMVSRAPFGIVVPGLTFWDSGPKVRPADIKKIEKRWREPLPPDYAAFLLCHNGGRPSKPFLHSHSDLDEDDPDYWYNEVCFFSTADKDPRGRPYLMMSVAEVYRGHVDAGADRERLGRMMPIAKVTRYDCNGMLALLMDGEEQYQRIIELVYWEHCGGVSEDDDVHAIDSFVGLLMQFCDRPAE